ncbi:unnamed protein product, partial [Ectocarpus sp. 12 AP-2014]
EEARGAVHLPDDGGVLPAAECLLRQLLRVGLLLRSARARRVFGGPRGSRGGGLAPVRYSCHGAEGVDPPGEVELLHQHPASRGISFDGHEIFPGEACKHVDGPDPAKP